PEGADQVQRRLPQSVAVDCGPQVDDVPLPAALLVETGQDILVQVDAEGPAAGITSMQRTGAAPLRTAAAQPVRQAQRIEHPGPRQLLFHMGKVEISILADPASAGYAGGTGRGDHLPSRLRVRPVARGLAFFQRVIATRSI